MNVMYKTVNFYKELSKDGKSVLQHFEETIFLILKIKNTYKNLLLKNT